MKLNHEQNQLEEKELNQQERTLHKNDQLSFDENLPVKLIYFDWEEEKQFEDNLNVIIFNLNHMERNIICFDEVCICQKNMPDLVMSTFGKCSNDTEDRRKILLRSIGQSLLTISLQFSRQ